jgi:hypothetical protein
MCSTRAKGAVGVQFEWGSKLSRCRGGTFAWLPGSRPLRHRTRAPTMRPLPLQRILSRSHTARRSSNLTTYTSPKPKHIHHRTIAGTGTRPSELQLHHHHHHRGARTPHTTITITRTMSSDADYAAFLDKANQDTGSAQAQESSKAGYGTKSIDTAVPQALQSVEEYYVSDADEPFEPVALQYGKAQIGAGELMLCCEREGSQCICLLTCVCVRNR